MLNSVSKLAFREGDLCISGVVMEFTLSLSYTSSRAAKRRGDPESLDLPLRGTKAWEYYNGFVTMFLATTGYAKFSPRRSQPQAGPFLRERELFRDVGLTFTVLFSKILQFSYFKRGSLKIDIFWPLQSPIPFFKGSAYSLDWIFRDAQKISLPGPPGLD